MRAAASYLLATSLSCMTARSPAVPHLFAAVCQYKGLDLSTAHRAAGLLAR